MTVIVSLFFVLSILLKIILWWAHVIVSPEVNRIVVFKSGVCIGLNVLIPFGGHVIPISMLGAKLLCKKAQKNDTKNIISDIINSIILIFIPFTTIELCMPMKVASRDTSRHHWYMVIMLIIRPKYTRWRF